MRLRRYIGVVSFAAALGVAAPLTHAAPTPQEYNAFPLRETSSPVVSPTLRDLTLEGVTEMFPAETIQQAPIQFVRLAGNTYLVQHPALYWRVEQEPAAQALAEELAERTPGWSTTLLQGPHGYGVYLTYRHSA